jgi:hypothetical protein
MTMLSEALTRRGDLMKKLVDLRDRTTANARFQEGSEAQEDPKKLMEQWLTAANELAELIARINLTNSATPFDDVNTLTNVLAKREALGRSRKFYTELADAASGRGKRVLWRYSKDEIRTLTTLDVPELRRLSDDTAAEYRKLDQQIQRLNFTTELL